MSLQASVELAGGAGRVYGPGERVSFIVRVSGPARARIVNLAATLGGVAITSWTVEQGIADELVHGVHNGPGAGKTRASSGRDGRVDSGGERGFFTQQEILAQNTDVKSSAYDCSFIMPSGEAAPPSFDLSVQDLEGFPMRATVQYVLQITLTLESSSARPLELTIPFAGRVLRPSMHKHYLRGPVEATLHANQAVDALTIGTQSRSRSRSKSPSGRRRTSSEQHYLLSNVLDTDGAITVSLPSGVAYVGEDLRFTCRAQQPPPHLDRVEMQLVALVTMYDGSSEKKEFIASDQLTNKRVAATIRRHTVHVPPEKQPPSSSSSLQPHGQPWVMELSFPLGAVAASKEALAGMPGGLPGPSGTHGSGHPAVPPTMVRDRDNQLIECDYTLHVTAVFSNHAAPASASIPVLLCPQHERAAAVNGGVVPQMGRVVANPEDDYAPPQVQAYYVSAAHANIPYEA